LTKKKKKTETKRNVENERRWDKYSVLNSHRCEKYRKEKEFRKSGEEIRDVKKIEATKVIKQSARM
jgi:hypothetical protein